MKAEGHTPLCDDYVSFETAKLLKEKGFDVPTERFYTENGRTLSGAYSYNWNDDEGDCSRPSLWLAMKWLRKAHNQIIVPGIRVEDPISGIINCYIVGIWYIPKNNGGAFCYTSPTPYNGYPSFEEACEAGIKYCLENLI